MPANPTINKVRIILPAGDERPAETIRLEEFTETTLKRALKDHFLKDDRIPAYTALYTPANDGTVSNPAIQSLLDTSGSVKPAKHFNGPDDLDSMIADVMTDVRARVKNNAEFTLQADDEKRPHCDWTEGELTKDVLQVQADVSLFLLEDGRTVGEKKAVILGDDAKEWVNTELEPKLEIVVNRAKIRNKIFHEPHHDLTPGLLLLDELFRRMVKEVDDMVRKINKKTKKGAEPDLTELEEFVKGLTVLGKGRDSEKYGNYIHRPGDHPCLCPADDTAPPFHVDPPRIDLFVDEAGQIRNARVKIGAWKGGTHSSGHTG